MDVGVDLDFVLEAFQLAIRGQLPLENEIGYLKKGALPASCSMG